MTMPPLPRPPEDIANDAWNAVQEGRPEAVSGPFGGTIMELHLRDDAGAIDPAFARRLGARLRPRAELGAAGTAPVPPRPLSPTPLADHAGSGAHHWLTAALVALAAAVVVALLGGPTLIDRSSGGGASRVAKVTSASPVVAPQVVFDRPDVGLSRGNPARTGELPGVGPSGAPEVVWRVAEPGRWFAGGAILAGDEIFMARSNESGSELDLVAVAVSTGTIREITQLKDQEWTVGAVADGIVVMPSNDAVDGLGRITGYMAEDGRPVLSWRASTSINVSSLLADEGILYLTTGDGHIHALNLRDGTERWSVRAPGFDSGAQIQGYWSEFSLIVSGGRLFGVGAGFAFAVDAQDGHELWSREIDGNVFQPGLVSEGVFVVAANTWGASMPGRVYGLDARTGAERWPPIDRPTGDLLAAGEGRLFLASWEQDGGTLSAYDLQTGVEAWTFERAAGFDYPVYADGWLWANSTGDGTVQRIDPASGRADWSVYLAGNGLLVADGKVIVNGAGGLVAVGSGAGVSDVPMASGAPDLSGLAPCTPPRSAPAALLEGTPAAFFEAETRLEQRPGGAGTYEDGRPVFFTEWPQILVENLPTGPAPDRAAVVAIQASLDGIGACVARPEGQRNLLGYFSDDFFRRGVAARAGYGYRLTWWNLQPTAEQISSLTAVSLPDGRIAAVVGEPGGDQGPALLLVFADIDSTLLIDEAYRIVTEYNFDPMG